MIKTLGCVEVLGTYVDESEIGGGVRTVSDDVVVLLCRLSHTPDPPSILGGKPENPVPAENTASSQYGSTKAA